MRRRGFTLVELLVTVAVASLLLVGLYQSMAASSRRFRQGESGMEAVHEAQRILEYLRHDVERPLLWNHPCDYPMDALEEMGVDDDRVEFATRDRHVARWFTYYHEGEGPTQDTTHHLAVNFWRTHPLAPCRLAWPDRGPYWKGREPGPRELKGWANPRGWVEFVPYPDKAVWLIGPAVWVHHPDEALLYRYSPGDGIHRFGAARLEGFAMMPTEEIAANYLPRPKPHWQSMQVKRMLHLVLTLRRDAGRPPLVLETGLTHVTRDFLPPPEPPPVAPAGEAP